MKDVGITVTRPFRSFVYNLGGLAFISFHRFGKQILQPLPTLERKGTDSRVVSNDDELTVRRDHPTYGKENSRL